MFRVCQSRFGFWIPKDPLSFLDSCGNVETAHSILDTLDVEHKNELVELAFLHPDPSWIGAFLYYMSKAGDTEQCKKILQDLRSEKIPRSYLGKSFRHAIWRSNEEILRVLIESTSFNLIEENDLFFGCLNAINENNENIIAALLAAGCFDVELVTDALGVHFTVCAWKGQIGFVRAVMNSSRFDEVLRFQLNIAFNDAVDCGHSTIVEAFLRCKRMNEISIEGLVSAFERAAARGCVEMVTAFLKYDVSDDISGRSVMRAFEAAAERGDTAVVQIIIESTKFNSISPGSLGAAIQAAARGGRQEIVAALSGVDRVTDLPQVSLEVASGVATSLGHVAIAELLTQIRDRRSLYNRLYSAQMID
jgi:hypothetical protein